MSKTTKTLSPQEAKDIVNRAINLDAAKSEHVAVADLEDVVEGVGVPRTRVREAMALREAEERASAAALRAKLARREELLYRARVFVRGATSVVGGVIGLAAVLTFLAMGELHDDNVRVVRAQEKVFAAIGRQQTTLSQVRGFTDPLNRDAEIAGAANRVAVAKNDYDIAVARYNGDASDSLTRMVLQVHAFYPTRLPFAREVWR
jgi:hypothetical protein